MKFSTALDSILASPTKVRLLRRFLSSPERNWTGREIARAAGVSTAQAARDLHELSDAGLTDWEVHGRSFSWQLNRENVLFPQLLALFQREANLRTELIRQIAVEFRTEPISRARLFGSVARGDERQDSDVDLFLEIEDPDQRPRIEDALERVRNRVWKTFGNPLAPLVYTSTKVKHPPNSALLAAIDRDGIEIPRVAESA